VVGEADPPIETVDQASSAP